MKIEITEVNGHKLAEIISEEIIIKETQDALDIMAESVYSDASRIILKDKNLTPEFFDLKTGLAGEILQKFSNYNVRLSIIGDFTKYKSRSLQDFIFESNKHGRINFVHSLEEAKVKMTR